MSAVRLRRLHADHQRVRDMLARHPRMELVQAQGTGDGPPDRYQIRIQVRSLRKKDDELAIVTDHLVEVMLPLAYPRVAPVCRMLTPVFHPNIAPHAICVGDHWSAGESLASLIIRIGEILAYQSYNTRSPLNGEAARWVEQNQNRLPLDPAHLWIDDPSPAPVPVAASALGSAAAPAAEPELATCPECAARLRVREVGLRLRCPRCQTIFTPPLPLS